MGFSRSRFGRRVCRRGLLVLLPAALVLWAAPGAGAANRIYWGSCFPNEVSFANLNGTGHGGDLKTTGVTPNCPQGVSMDLLSGKIYWADTGQGGGATISFANLNDTGGGHHLDTTGATSPAGPVGVATDPATGKLYWGNLDGPPSFANLNDTGGGGDLSISGATAPNFVYGVAIDPATGKIYWANAHAGTISFANLNGTGNGGDLKTTGATVDTPEGVAIDPTTGKIYWANKTNNTHPISFANLNDTGGGGNLKVTGATADGASGVAIDPEAGKIYWANFDGNTISFANLNGTGGGGELKTTGATAPNGAALPALVKAPLATAKPKISGGSTVGSKLSCSKGKWASDLLESFLYQRPVSFSDAWSRNGKPISGATTNSITASSAGTYTCTVTATNQAGSTKNTSTAHTVT
jgi:DNA-binding beta-propeller fold protein YncE